MMTQKLCRGARELRDLIEREGGRVLDLQHQAKHTRIDFTFDGSSIHSLTLPRNSSAGGRWMKNFQAAVRRAKRNTNQRGN